MEDRFEQEEEELRRARTAKRIAKMRREKQRQLLLRKRIKLGIKVFAACVCIGFVVMTVKALLPNTPGSNDVKARQSGESTQTAAVQAVDEQNIVTQSEDANSGDNSWGNGSNEQAENVPAGENGTAATVSENLSDEMMGDSAASAKKVMVGDKEFWGGYEAKTTESTTAMNTDDVMSSYAILINASTGDIVADRNGTTRINPASMTKILTVLVAAEQIENLDEEVPITFEMTDYAYVHDCSVAGFEVDEKVPVRDLFYGTILPSGGEAAMALAIHTAGSEEAFIELMNKKLEELGLADTAHFTNCVGLYNENHYCTTYDMAIILKAALENELCREVITSRTYQTTPTTEHPEGLLLSNWFLRRIEDKDCGGQVLGAKTGYVNESGSCAASYGVSASGTPYICVTADASSSWRCIYDHVSIYSIYAR